jgi:Ca-activated chloride channel family protein
VSFLVPAAGVALLALPLITILYFLKVRRPQARVATLLFWRPYVADRQANAPWQRLRFGWLLFLQLLAACLLGLALMRPGLVGAAGVSRTTVVLIDASPSMAATDVQPSRFGSALDRVRSMADQLAPGEQMALILVGPSPQLLSPPTGDAQRLKAALARAHPSTSAGNFAEAISLANSILAGRPGGSIVMLSDGHTFASSPPTVYVPFTYDSIGTSGENTAIESISQNPNGSIFIELANYGRASRSLHIDLYADGRLVDVLPVQIGPGTTTAVTWDRLPAGTHVLEAKLDPPDDFTLDDAAWLLTAPPAQERVLLVTSGNPFLEKALQLRPGLQLTTETPARYRSGDYDLYVFDGWLPARVPHPALIVDPPPDQGPVPLGAEIDPGAVQPGNPRDPLLQNVDLSDVHVLTAEAAATVPSGWRTVIAAASDPLLLVHDASPRAALFTFDLHHSDLVLQAAFPILIQNLLQYLLPGGFQNQTYQLGQPVDLQVAPGTRSVRVSAPDGTTTALSPPYAFTGTTQPGVYTVRERTRTGIQTSQFVVQLQAPTISQIAPGAAPPVVEKNSATASAPPPLGTLEIWQWFAAAALVLLVAEWALWLRPGGGRLRRRRQAVQ